MPRKQKQQVAPNLPYGQGVEQARAMKAVPLPDKRTPVAAPQAPPAPQPAPRFSMEQMMAAAQGMPGFDRGLLQQGPPTALPVSAGLSTGPGPGPEALNLPRNPTVQVFRQVYEATGDPWFLELARRIGLQ